MKVTTDEDVFLTADEMNDKDLTPVSEYVNRGSPVEQTSAESSIERPSLRPQITRQAPNRLTYDNFSNPRYDRISKPKK